MTLDLVLLKALPADCGLLSRRRQMPILRNHKGYKLLLEEDYYFGPDALHVLGKVRFLLRDSALTLLLFF